MLAEPPPDLTLSRLIATLEIYRAAGPARAAEVATIERFLAETYINLESLAQEPKEN